MATQTIQKKRLCLNYVHNKASAVSVDAIPTLVPASVMDELLTDPATNAKDSNPFFRVESIEYPAEGDNPLYYEPAIYGEEFFQSFLEVMNAKPVPGSKRGHEFKSRPQSDFYTVGGSLVKSGNGKGVAHLKIYIPPVGDETSNAGFIRDNRAGIVQFSIQSMVEYAVNQDTREVTIMGVKGGERNDAVPVGAMAQTVNADEEIDEVLNAEGDTLLASSVRKARGLINAGKYNAKGSWSKSRAVKKILGASGDDFANLKAWSLVEHTSAPEDTQARYGYQYGDGTIVFRSALQNAAARASGQNLPQVSKAASALVALIGEKESASSQMGGSLMDDKKEMLDFVAVNRDIPITEIANAMGKADQIATDEQRSALKVVNELKELGITDPVAEVKKARAQAEENERNVIANRLTKEFGPEKFEDGRVNTLRAYAAKQITNAEALDKQVEDLKADPVAKTLATQRADYHSVENKLGIVEHREGEVANPDEPRQVAL